LFPTRAQSASSAEPSVQQLSLIRSPDVLTCFEKSGLATSGVCRPGSVQSLSHFDVRLSGAGWAQAVVLVV
jgi:hypothetical protein